MFSMYLFIFGCAGSSLPLRFFSSCSERRLLFSCSAQVSHRSGFSCGRAWALGHMGFSSFNSGRSSCHFWALEHRLNSCGAQAYLLCSMWDIPRPGMESCTGRLILYHWATREAQIIILFTKKITICFHYLGTT